MVITRMPSLLLLSFLLLVGMSSVDALAAQDENIHHMVEKETRSLWIQAATSLVQAFPFVDPHPVSKNVLHLMDPGVAEEDMEEYYDLYDFDLQSEEQEEEDEGPSSMQKQPWWTRDTPSTLTCQEDGTCVLTEEEQEEPVSQESSFQSSSPGVTTLSERATATDEAGEESELDDTASDWAAGADLGEPQVIPENTDQEEAVREQIRAARNYITNEVNHVDNRDKYDKVRSLCRNKHAHCAFWAASGECSANPAYMLINCAPVCQSCDQLHVDNRCPMDPNAVDAWHPGDLNKMFERIVTDPAYQPYQPKVLSRPTYANGDTADNATYQLGLWMVQLDQAVTEEEADRLIELGSSQGYERSSDVGEEQPDGTFTNHVNDRRTSTNSWCTGDCHADPVAQRVMERISNITGIPTVNSENLQLLRYETGQFYRTHNDYIPYQKRRPTGVRIATFYIYLNDVPEGGETNFPRNHNLSVQPKKGRAVLWPSVLDQDPNEQDRRSDHQAQPVVRGVKYGANAWIHQRDFQGPNSRGC